MTGAYLDKEADREDLFQEIAMALWQAIPKFRGQSSGRTWLYRIAHNVAISSAAKVRRRGQAEKGLPEEAGEAAASADGKSIQGTWTQGRLPLEFKRGTMPQKAAPRPAKPSDIDGAWEGTLDAGTQKLRVVFHLINTEDGLRGTMDSPDQGAKGLPVTAVTRDGAKLTLEMKQVGGRFEGKIGKGLATIDGAWRQGGENLPLMLHRVKQ